MKLLRFFPPTSDGSSGDSTARDDANTGFAQSRLGLATNDGVLDLTEHQFHSIPQALDPAAATQLAELAELPPEFAWEQITFAPPVEFESKLLCAGANYHKKYPLGGDVQAPAQPVYFNKPPGVLAAHDQPLIVPRASDQLDYEVELAVVIGQGGRHISPAEVPAHIGGYTVLNDGSVRNWQRHSVAAGKNFHMAGSLGPWIVTPDDPQIPSEMRVSCKINGELRQDAGIGEMIFPVAELVSYLSQIFPLRTGDVISTGSPEGTGGSHDPPQWLQAGDVVECEVTGVGVLRNHVIAEADAK